MDDATERWVSVLGWEDLYEVSSLGRVRSLPRLSRDGRRFPGRMLGRGRKRHGHPVVDLSRDGRASTVRVHALVAEAFIGAQPRGTKVRHGDGNPSNCNAANLSYVSRAEPRVSVRIGQRIGAGVVIEPDIRVPGGRGGIRTERGARLICDCGNEYTRRIYDLIGDGFISFSCGCLNGARRAAGSAKGGASRRGRRPSNFIERSGQRYGRLLVIRLADPRSGKAGPSWVCLCDCGNETIVRASSLASNRGTRSCGCRKNRAKLPPGIAGRNRVLKAYRGGARTRGFPWELTVEDFDRLTSQDCYYCGQPPSTVENHAPTPFTYNGIDRVNSKIGYTPDNVVPCCQICNRAKSDLPYDAWVAWLGRMTAYQWFNPGQMPSRLLKGAA